MKIKLRELRSMIHNVLINEFGPIRGGLRKTSGKPRYNTGYVEDVNRELSASEADSLFPGSVEAWCEIVPELWSEAPLADFDPRTIRLGSVFFKEGNKLTAAFESMPTIKLAEWDSQKQDWIETDFTESQTY